ncbi:IS30 family transposase, partial [Nocardia gipuzkoensis]
AEGGPGKRTGSNPGTAPRSDPYIIGTDRSASGTLVDRTTRYTVLVHLPREHGWGKSAPVENGPALSGYGALSMNKALSAAPGKVPARMLKSLTWDRGKELSAHATLTSKTGIPVFFADPHSPWRRGSNENTNGPLRQSFPKGTNLSRWTARDLAAVAHALNTRPRKVLGWRTPAEAMNHHLQSLERQSVASTS